MVEKGKRKRRQRVDREGMGREKYGSKIWSHISSSPAVLSLVLDTTFSLYIIGSNPVHLTGSIFKQHYKINSEKKEKKRKNGNSDT